MKIEQRKETEGAKTIFTITVNEEEMVAVSRRSEGNFLSNFLESEKIQDKIYGLFIIARRLKEGPYTGKGG